MVFLILSNITLIFYVHYVGGVYLHNAHFACTTALGLGQYSRKYLHSASISEFAWFTDSAGKMVTCFSFAGDNGSCN